LNAPERIPMPADVGGLRLRDWMELAMAAIDGQPEDWRWRWLDMNQAELSDLRRIRSDWAEKITAAATSTDSPPGG
jgi:hypothetical protein